MNPFLISLNDFEKISNDNEFWVWHLIDSIDNPLLEIQPLSKQIDRFHALETIINKTQIPYFETVIYDAMDFLLYLDNTILQKLKTKKPNRMGTALLGFNHSRFVYSTLHYCYCPEGVLEVIAKLNPEYLTNLIDD